MRVFALGLVVLISSGVSMAQKNIRQIDFKNFRYPLSGPLLGHDRLQWLDLPSMAHPSRKPIHLVNGTDLTKASSFVMDGREYAQWEGFTLESVQFADLTGDGKEEAIIVLRYNTGGTQNTNYVYIYTFEDGKPKLLAYCYTGDRAYFGLNKVYGDHGTLVFELSDPRKSSGDCCSSGFVRVKYRWHEGRFEAFGAREFGTLKGP